MRRVLMGMMLNFQILQTHRIRRPFVELVKVAAVQWNVRTAETIPRVRWVVWKIQVSCETKYET